MESPSTSTATADPRAPAGKLVVSSVYRRPSSAAAYGDSFIPSRSSSNFALFNLPNSTTSDGNSSAYTTLLKSALFGPQCVGGVNFFQPLAPEKFRRFGDGNGDGSFLQISPPNCNIFKYKTESKKFLRSRSLFDFDDQLHGVPYSPVKTPRKVPRSPFKVPSLSHLVGVTFFFSLI